MSGVWRTLGGLCLAALFALSLVGVSPALASSSPAAQTNSVCAAGYGLTPWGCALLSCIHLVGNGASVSALSDGSTLVTYSNGQTQTFQTCSSPHFSTNGWVEDAYDEVKVTQLSGDWTVPKAPKDNVGQTIFMFDATQNCICGDAFIIQPVIQWGESAAGGGAYWALASWYVYSGGYFVSTLISIDTGNTILGTLTSSGCNKSGACNWLIDGKDKTLGTFTSLSEGPLAEQAYGFVTLEVYGVSACSDYPASGSTTFSALKLDKGTPSWTGDVLINDGCNEKVTVISGHTVKLSY